jgi:phosphoglycolate phosphatase
MLRFPFAVVAFDLDGTLADTSPDLTDALNYMLAQLKREPVPGARVIELVGRGMRNLMERALGATGPMRPALVEEALPIFLQYYEAHIADRSRPYEGATVALDLLRARGAKLALCTNKPEHLARKLVEAFGWSERFESVVGGDTLPARKPDPAPLHEAIRQAGGGPTVLVGDSITDIQTATAAGLPCVAVTFGYRDRPATELGATALIDRFDQLAGALETLRWPSNT